MRPAVTTRSSAFRRRMSAETTSETSTTFASTCCSRSSTFSASTKISSRGSRSRVRRGSASTKRKKRFGPASSVLKSTVTDSFGPRGLRRAFDPAPEQSVRLESTPFYLYVPSARRRIADELPHAKLIVIVRDPIDRAYSNWMHLWVDGLEPIGDFVEGWRAEDSRIAAGWAPFWHYRQLGRYGQQLADLLGRVDRDRVLVLRYWHLVSQPTETLHRVARFLGIAENRVSGALPPDNFRPFVEPGLRASLMGRAIRAGAAAGSHVPPQIWRRVSKPLVEALRYGGASQRPKLAIEQRTALLAECEDDIATLERVLGESFNDWRSAGGRGSFAERTAVIQP